MKWWKKIMNELRNPVKPEKLKKWQDKYATAKHEYEDTLAAVRSFAKMYEGDPHVERNRNKGGGESKEMSINVRNITFDLVESEVSPEVPFPKVIPVHQEDVEQAKAAEAFLRGYVLKLHLKAKNDIHERTTPVEGGSYNLVEWDNTKKTHTTVGDLRLEGLYPEEVIPQPGVTEIDNMDYFFIRKLQTVDYIKRRFGKEVDGGTGESDLSDRNLEDLAELITVYYRNEEGGIGLFRWVGNEVVEDLDDYEARYVKKCKKCGATVVGDKCEECGSKSFETVKEEETTVTKKIREVSADEFGNPIVSEREVEITLPYYKPREFPLVLRRNISKKKSLLGFSDADAIKDQQDTVKKLGSKVNEKLLKAGSVITLPEDVNIETNDKEFKLARIKNPQQMSMISVITCQADVSKDLTYLETNYQWAKSSLGITDAYQGKYDSSATSGTAKQYSINQAAGRLESKKVMKNEAYARLYELFFKYALAFMDGPMPIYTQGEDGELEFTLFDPSDYIKIDDAGEPYWNDEFLFTIDETSTLMMNKEAMWQQTNMLYQSGAYGQVGTLESMHLYWTAMARSGYPYAEETLAYVEQKLHEQNEQQAMLAQMQAQAPMLQEGVPNDMPQM